MKKFVFALIFMVALSHNAYAGYYDGLYASSDDRVREKIPISELDNAAELIERLSPENLFESVKESFAQALPSLKGLIAALVASVAASLLVSCAATRPEARYLSVGASAVAAVILHNAVYPLLAEAFVSLTSINGFISLIFSFMAAGLAAGGKTVTASILPTASATVIGVLSQINTAVIIPLTNALLCIIYAASIENGILPKLCGSVKNAVLGLITVSCFVFTSVTALQKSLTEASDSIGSSAVKLAVSGSMPVIGGTVRDAFDTVASSSNLIVSTAGFFGIAALLILLLPGLIKLLLSLGIIKFACAVGSNLSSDGAATVLKGIEGVFEITSAIYGCEVMYTLVSIGIMISCVG